MASPRRLRAAVIAWGSRSRPRTVAPTSRRIAAWPPPPSVASTARVLPRAHARTAAARTGMWYGIDGEPEAAVGTLHNKKPPPFAGGGGGYAIGESQAGLTGLEPATSGVTDRHSNQLSYSPKPLTERRNKNPRSGQFK